MILLFTVNQLTNYTMTRIHYTTIHYTRLPKKCICINIGKKKLTRKKTSRILDAIKATVVLVGGGVSICFHGSEVYYSFLLENVRFEM